METNLIFNLEKMFNITSDEAVEILLDGFSYKYKGNIPDEIISKIDEMIFERNTSLYVENCDKLDKH